MAQVQFITHFTERYDYLDSVHLALEGGCRWVQLRIKGATDEELLDAARQVRLMCNEYGSTFIVDDNVYVAREVEADGVHLGKNDMPIAQARELLGSKYIIGATANTFEDVKAHYIAGADYIGCGPFRFTTTKEKLSPVLGLDGYRSIVTRMKEEGIEIPVVAIGGITSADIVAVMQTGVSGIALSGTILRAEDPVKEMKSIIKIINKWKN